VDLSITVGRQDLITALEAKVTELDEQAAELVAEVTERKKTRKSTRDATAEWYVTIGKMITEKRAVIVSGNGGHGETANGIVAVDPDTDPVPELPTRNTRGNDTRMFNERIRSIEYNREMAVNAVSATIKLLKISSDETVPVKTSDYDKLLGLSVRDRHYY
jgi:hypothetical protein